MNAYALKNMATSNKPTFYQNNVKQNLSNDQTAQGTIAKPEFTKTNQTTGEIVQAKQAWNGIQKLSPQIQDVQTQQVQNVVQANQSKFYNGMSLDPKKASFLKQNQQIYTQVDGSQTVQNIERPIQDQTIGGGDSKQQMLMNQAVVSTQQAIQNFQPQYNAALSRQATDQKPVDQTKAIDEYNPNIVYERKMFNNDYNRYSQLDGYTKYMNSFNNPDSRYHKIDSASMLRTNTVQVPTNRYLNTQQEMYQSQPRQVINQQTQGLQKIKLYNKSILDTQRINLFQQDTRNIINQQSAPIQQTTTQQTSNKQQIYQYIPNNNYVQCYVAPQIRAQSNHQNYPSVNIQSTTNNFLNKPEQTITSGQDIFNSSFLFRR